LRIATLLLLSLAAPAGIPGQRAAAPTRGTVKAPDGVDIAYEVAGSGAPALVFVHGWSCDRSYWRAQFEHFARSHRALAIDLGGHGESGLGREDWTIAAFGADVCAVLEALAVEDAVLVGHSMGGPVILEAARLAPERVAALVPVDTLFDVGHAFGPAEREAFLAPFRADFPAAADRFARRMFTARSDPELVERIAADISAAPPDVAISAMESLFAYDGGAALAALEVPLRLLNADSYPTNLEAARRRKPDVELAVMPRSGHFLMAEDPAEFNRLLARAVQELTGG